MARRPRLRKDTKADHVPPDLEDEIMVLAPDIGARVLVRCARLHAMLWLDKLRKEQA
ncbi:hypothetical protein [Thauera sp.]|uniref:hypothetical protein n=1 Tax=Thauera sp. TaxID=1905334 RepID=UPI002C34F635|nr:hypothetical protein [Thauera sp.]HRP25370.1 hypothetical protein [Thauera sp.]